jgi:hypothetical protein
MFDTSDPPWLADTCPAISCLPSNMITIALGVLNAATQHDHRQGLHSFLEPSPIVLSLWHVGLLFLKLVIVSWWILLIPSPREHHGGRLNTVQIGTALHYFMSHSTGPPLLSFSVSAACTSYYFARSNRKGLEVFDSNNTYIKNSSIILSSLPYHNQPTRTPACFQRKWNREIARRDSYTTLLFLSMKGVPSICSTAKVKLMKGYFRSIYNTCCNAMYCIKSIQGLNSSI